MTAYKLTNAQKQHLRYLCADAMNRIFTTLGDPQPVLWH